MDIKRARNGDVEIAYACLGPPDGTPLVLLNGSGMQLVMWPEELCTALVDRGFHVIRMDNRDSGLSTRFTEYDDRPWHRPGRAYTIQDMADDVIAVLDAANIRRAHLMGGSLGAVIAQVAAIHHPDRVSALVLMSTMPGGKFRLAKPKIRTMAKMAKLMRGESPDADAEGQRWVDLQRLVGSPHYPLDEEHWRGAGRLAYQRGIYSTGSLRHTRALMGAGDLRPQLATLNVPTLVVQGKLDPLMHWTAAKVNADAIPGARFLLLEDVGHDLPREVWPSVLDQISGASKRASSSGAGGSNELS